MDAVGSIDDEPHLPLVIELVKIRAKQKNYLIVGLVLIHSGGTEPTLRPSIFCLNFHM